jgi:LPXTG-motif cell wall-anchored protein
MSKRVVCAAFAVAAIVHGLATTATASVVQQVPEISPASISAGLAILAGGVLMLRARRKK